jgi:hypothetical protein
MAKPEATSESGTRATPGRRQMAKGLVAGALIVAALSVGCARLGHTRASASSPSTPSTPSPSSPPWSRQETREQIGNNWLLEPPPADFNPAVTPSSALKLAETRMGVDASSVTIHLALFTDEQASEGGRLALSHIPVWIAMAPDAVPCDQALAPGASPPPTSVCSSSFPVTDGVIIDASNGTILEARQWGNGIPVTQSSP